MSKVVAAMFIKAQLEEVLERVRFTCAVGQEHLEHAHFSECARLVEVNASGRAGCPWPDTR